MANDILVHGEAGKIEVTRVSSDSTLSLDGKIGSAILPTSLVVSPLSYHELSNRQAHRGNVLEELKAHLSQLEDLHARLSFMMGEVRTLIRKI